MSITIERDGPVTTICINRPEARNAVNPETARALYEAFLAFDDDDDAAVAVFGSSNGAFCAGFDLKYAGALGPDKPLAEKRYTGRLVRRPRR